MPQNFKVIRVQTPEIMQRVVYMLRELGHGAEPWDIRRTVDGQSVVVGYEIRHWPIN